MLHNSNRVPQGGAVSYCEELNAFGGRMLHSMLWMVGYCCSSVVTAA